MKIEDFDAFVKAVLDSIPDGVDNEWYGTDYQITKQLLDSARERMFEQELARQARYQQYLILKAEFETKGE